jgi:hypothetical protein
LTQTARQREALARLVARLDLDELARSIVALCREQIPSFQRITDEDTLAHILATARLNVELMVRWLVEGRPPSEGDIAVVQESARARAREGVPLEDLLTAYRLGGRRGWQALLQIADQEEREAMFVVTDALFRYLDAVSSRVIRPYVEQRELVVSETERGARRLLAGLCEGDPLNPEDQEFAERLGFPIRNAYLPFAAVLPSHPAIRHAELATLLRRRSLLAITEGSRVTGLATRALRLEEAGGANGLLVAQGPPTPRCELRDVIDELRSRTDVARRAGRTGIVGPEEFLPELLLHGSRRVADRIEQRVFKALEEPEQGELAATLRAYAANDFDRQRTARALPVHRNTLTCRLQRIEQLSGLDLAAGEDRTLIWLATANRDFREQRAAGGRAPAG